MTNEPDAYAIPRRLGEEIRAILIEHGKADTLFELDPRELVMRALTKVQDDHEVIEWFRRLQGREFVVRFAQGETPDVLRVEFFFGKKHSLN
jgi:hypothetical protein